MGKDLSPNVKAKLALLALVEHCGDRQQYEALLTLFAAWNAMVVFLEERPEFGSKLLELTQQEMELIQFRLCDAAEA